MEAQIRNLLSLYYHGLKSETKISFLIQCPWHEDNSPSCQIYKNSGVFKCWSCHSDKRAGVSPYHGFQALGMPQFEAEKIFFTKENISYEPLNFEMPVEDLKEFENFDLENLDDLIACFEWAIENDPNIHLETYWRDLKKAELTKEQYCKWKERNNLTTSRREWEKTDGLKGNYREILYETMKSKAFKEAYDPSIVTLKREKEERLALRIGNSLYYEVYLRQKPDSTLTKKSINQKNFTFKADRYISVSSPFGLKNWEVIDNAKALLITEGPYDCLRLHQHILQNALPFQVTALLGTPNTEDVFFLLEKKALFTMFKKKIPLILAFDHDDAGFKATSFFLELYKKFFDMVSLRGEAIGDYIKILPYPLEIEDCGDLPAKAFLNALGLLGIRISS